MATDTGERLHFKESQRACSLYRAVGYTQKIVATFKSHDRVVVARKMQTLWNDALNERILRNA